MNPTASERLAISRERLRQALKQAADKSSASPSGSGASKTSPSIDSSAVLSKIVDIFLDGNPIRATAMEGVGLLHDWLKPAVQRNPLAMTAGAVALGAVAAKVLLHRSVPHRYASSANTWLPLLAALLLTRRAPK
jgi:hypothetical protein